MQLRNVFNNIVYPITKLTRGFCHIAKEAYDKKPAPLQEGERGQLASEINKMGKEIAEKQAELNRQKYEYQNLFENVPCLITVHDREFKLIKYNREFADKFAPKPGEYCYSAYKGRDEKCENCPTEKTFQDGKPHFSEGTGISKDGTVTHWMVRTSPIKNSSGEIVAAIEMNLDVTPYKQLEYKLKRSEEKYRAIFNNIPNPVFVLDFDTLEILDCNHRVNAVYGYTAHEIISRSFMDFFHSDEDNEVRAKEISSKTTIHQAKHRDKTGRMIYVDIWISPSEYPEKKVLLVTTSDITERLETEHQLIQAGKMATLGEMATGVAHELNQPLSVIKTASSFIIKKIRKNEKIEDKHLSSMLFKVDSNVDRASNIITHMRQFARKSDMDMEKVQINEVLENSFEIFSQQLKIRGIRLVWLPEDSLPRIMADPSRLEQVFINLLVNARDAIEQKWEKQGYNTTDDEIKIQTKSEGDRAIVEVSDTGTGISETISEKLFEPFFTTKEVGKGTGLGLSISYGIIKKCRGDITVESIIGGGATFIISFPIPEH
ncbi:MAG: PAS domain S-box protein [Deltaproteobacteria bacterium]|nr:PAS domain S-box protein [Deltaproteobacteria bacterium]